MPFRDPDEIKTEARQIQAVLNHLGFATFVLVSLQIPLIVFTLHAWGVVSSWFRFLVVTVEASAGVMLVDNARDFLALRRLKQMLGIELALTVAKLGPARRKSP